MAAPEFYRAIPAEISQGDIFERVPLAYLTEVPRPLQEVTLEGRSNLLEFGNPLDPHHPPTSSSGLRVVAACDFTRAVLPTYDCEIDKPATKHLALALIRPLDASMPTQSQQIIRENRKFSTFYLPAGDPSLQESFVDFIRVSTLPKDLLKASPRIACLSEEARQAMLFQLIRFLSRKDLSAAFLQPPA